MEDYGLYGRAAEILALGSEVLGHDYLSSPILRITKVIYILMKRAQTVLL